MRRVCGLVPPQQHNWADAEGTTGMETPPSEKARRADESSPLQASSPPTEDLPPAETTMEPPAREQVEQLERDQLVELVLVLLEAMPNSYQWSIVSSIRREQRRRPPACRDRLQMP